MSEKQICRKLCLVITLILFYLNYVNSDNRTPLKLSFLASTSGHAKLFAGAYFIALEYVNNNTTLLEGYRLEYLYNDTRMNSLNAINSMTEHHRNSTVGFIGPDVSCHCESNIAAAWNLPMIAYVSRYFENKK